MRPRGAHMHNTLSHNTVYFSCEFQQMNSTFLQYHYHAHALHLGCRIHTVGLLLSGHPAGRSPSHCVQTHHLSVLFFIFIHTL